jgi:membrane protease YdiL (CAAX protease family)
MHDATPQMPCPAASEMLGGSSESPTRSLFVALVLVLGAFAAGVAAAFVGGFVIGIHNGAVLNNPTRTWRVPPIDFALLSIAVTDVMMLLAAWGRAAIVGGGNVVAGLGAGPIRRPRLLAILALAGSIVISGWIVLLLHWVTPTHAGIVTLARSAVNAAPVVQGALLACIVLLSPVWEEFFFRGWLWTALRRHWRPFPVMMATAVPWLLLHMLDGLSRPLFLIPAAIIFSLARHYCDSVRASLTLHVLNNLIAMAIVTVAISHGQV